MATDPQNAYRAELARALEKCQFIEETLKMCLLSAAEIARIQLRSFFPVNIKPQDVSSLPLGPLVKAFQKIHNDKTLLKDLRAITKARNDVAHRSLLFTIGELEDEAHMSKATLRMKAIADRATDIHHRTLDVYYALVRSLSKVRRTQEKAIRDQKRAQQVG